MHLPKNLPRLACLLGFFGIFIGIFLFTLYDTQVVHGKEYLAQSIQTITTTQTIEAARGVITDRNGLPMVSNRSTYQLTFKSSAVSGDESDICDAILRILQLCQAQDVTWTDNLPITKTFPYSYQIENLTSTQRNRFLTFLQSIGAIPTTWTSDNLTNNFLLEQWLPAADLLDLMADTFSIPHSYSVIEQRNVAGIYYELELRNLMNITSYVMADDISLEMITLLNDGDFHGASVSATTTREYQTPYAAHLLGTVGEIYAEDYAVLKELGYAMDDQKGESGVELAFEEYLRGIDGRSVITTNAEGKVTSELYSVEPQPGNTVELTIDLKLQQAVETALGNTMDAMIEKDGETTRGAGAAVVAVGSGEVLALASYPTFDLSTYRQDYTTLLETDGDPLVNRATQGTYAPGSTFKPITAIAALEENIITPSSKLYCNGVFNYPNADFYFKCWISPGAHGSISVTEALRVSCNDFFCELGYRLGITTMNSYASAFGLGQPTGIEIGERSGVLAGPDYSESVGATWYGGNTVQAAVGQSDTLATPIQLANYIATLAGGGDHYDATLLKAVKSYDNTELVASGAQEPSLVMGLDEDNVSAVLEGMYNLTQTSLKTYFSNCIVSAGAKTGTAQVTDQTTNNGVFVCFAPYEDPEIAVAIVIEKGGSGSALASTAVEILNAYFTEDEIGTLIIGENQLLQ
ncbi:penicillin-binding transpeptidase domain-containing protein [Bengtsoniella intestinalis]|uniref:penicillin-binding transpeptidase domain-containing protein n=1 Tax=Bengtsoniella intestinalis TaxID=3073143 RepID=UPI00391EE68C